MLGIIGAGISGLSSAYYLLKKRKFNLTLTEANNNVGGWIKTIKDPLTGLNLQIGPRTLRPNGKSGENTLMLVKDLQLVNKIISVSKQHSSATNRFLFVNNQLHMLSNNFKSVFNVQSPLTKPLIYYMLCDLFKSRKISKDESVYNFVERRFGVEMADLLISPLVCGICAGDAKEISVKFLLPKLFEYEQRYGSVTKGFFRDGLSRLLIDNKSNADMPIDVKSCSMWGLDDGLRLLTDSLFKYIIQNEVEVLLNNKIVELSFSKSQINCRFNNNKIMKFNHIICTVPAFELASMIKNEHPFLANQLNAIHYVDIIIVNLAYEDVVLHINGFGFLVAPSENIPLLGIIFDSCIFVQNNKFTVLTVMLGGRFYEKFADKLNSVENIYNLTEFYVNKILKIKSKPVVRYISILKKCIPQYTVGHYDRINEINNYVNVNKLPLTIIGSYTNGIGVNDVILNCKLSVDKLIGKIVV